MIVNILGAASMLAYLALSWFILRRPRVEDTKFRRVKPILIAIALTLHGLLCIVSLSGQSGLEYSLLNLLILKTLVMALIVVALNVRIRQDLLSVFIFGYAFGTLSMNLLVGDPDSPRVATDLTTFVHVFMGVAAYSLLGLAAFQTAIFSLLRASLRSKQHLKIVLYLPPLDVVERMNFGLMASGLIALSITLVVAFFVYWVDLDQPLHRVHTLIALLAWLLYAGILLGRAVIGWHGKITNLLSIIAFVVLTCSFAGLGFAGLLID